MQLGESIATTEAIWHALPAVTWLLQIDEVKPGAQVLAVDPGRTNQNGSPLPVIVRHYVGAGDVLFHATDETWRWRWRTDDRYFARYWGQVVRRLGRGRLAAGRGGVRLRVDRSRYVAGERVGLQARFVDPSRAPAGDDAVVVRLESDNGPPRELNLRRRLGRRGVFDASVEALPPGNYVARMLRPRQANLSAEARFEVRVPKREMARVAVDMTSLRNAAERTGGRSYEVGTASQLRNDLPLPRESTVDRLPPRTLWNSNAMLAVFVAVLTIEWLWRRRVGML